MFVIEAQWSPQLAGCIVTKIDNAFLESTFFFSLSLSRISVSALC
jgi:hypothetical protein